MDFKGIDLGGLHFPADLPALQLWVKKIGGPLIASFASLVCASEIESKASLLSFTLRKLLVELGTDKRIL